MVNRTSMLKDVASYLLLAVAFAVDLPKPEIPVVQRVLPQSFPYRN